MKRNKSTQKLKEAGITLIALVVTIIILLILAGVTLNLVLGEQGLIGKAQFASNTMAEATRNEMKKMNEFVADVDTQAVGFVNGQGGSGGSGGGDNVDVSVSGVDFGTKTARTIETGEDLSIGTEQFRVLKTDKSTEIIAIPHYIITLSETDPVQTTADTGNSTAFCNSSDANWTSTGDLNLEQQRSLIQRYIQAYSTKLSNLTEGKVTARAGKYSEMNDIAIPEGSNLTANAIRNPGQKRCYWLGTAYYDGQNKVYTVGPNGTIYTDRYGDMMCVRPVIVIDIT